MTNEDRFTGTDQWLSDMHAGFQYTKPTKEKPMTPAPLPDRYEQADVVNTIKQTVAKGATDAELKMFIEVCRSTGLNPFLREIWYVAQTHTIMAGRDGYLRVANENPQFDGIETRVERDADNVPIKAVCTVWRKDRSHPTICEAYFNEYVKGSPVWKQYPSAMIGKVAEVLALKRSFAINGVVTEEEIGGSPPPVTINAAGEITGGSQQAADELAKEKIAAITAGASARQVADVLTDTAVAAEETKPTKKPRKAPSKFQMLEAFKDIKNRFEAMNMVDIYYDHLHKIGLNHSNQFPDDENGLEAARACFKSMSQELSELEVAAKKATE